MNRLLGAALMCCLASLAVACGGDMDRTDRTRTALQRGVLKAARGTPAFAGTTAVECDPAPATTRRWTCTLTGTARQSATVSIDRRGRWRASIPLPSAPAPVTTTEPSMSTGEFTSGGAAILLGCCVPAAR
jgi:hypothetical protein